MQQSFKENEPKNIVMFSLYFQSDFQISLTLKERLSSYSIGEGKKIFRKLNQILVSLKKEY